MAVSEEKMRIVINNYFKSECNVDTSIREAFEKGFKIGVKKGQLTSLGKETERKTGKWIGCKCNQCGGHAPFWSMSSTYYCSNYCPHCGARMEADGEEARRIKKQLALNELGYPYDLPKREES